MICGDNLNILNKNTVFNKPRPRTRCKNKESIMKSVTAVFLGKLERRCKEPYVEPGAVLRDRARRSEGAERGERPDIGPYIDPGHEIDV